MVTEKGWEVVICIYIFIIDLLSDRLTDMLSFVFMDVVMLDGIITFSTFFNSFATF